MLIVVLLRRVMREDAVEDFFEGFRLAAESDEKLCDFGHQHVRDGSTIKSYLSCLYDSGRVKAEFIDNEMLWSAVQ